MLLAISDMECGSGKTGRSVESRFWPHGGASSPDTPVRKGRGAFVGSDHSRVDLADWTCGGCSSACRKRISAAVLVACWLQRNMLLGGSLRHISMWAYAQCKSMLTTAPVKGCRSSGALSMLRAHRVPLYFCDDCRFDGKNTKMRMYAHKIWEIENAHGSFAVR